MYVASLEGIDAELRGRMARLGLGEIPGAAGDTGGCGLCYEPYERDDRPSWFDASADDARVVGIPCAGQHVVHAACLAAWLSTTGPSDWTCPFCRRHLPEHLPVWSAHAKLEAGKAARSVRDEVRVQERRMGWRCDDPSCLPSYPDKDEEGSEPELCRLTPCRHDVHLACIERLIRVHQGTWGESNGIVMTEPPTRSTPYRLPHVARANSFASPPAADRPASVHASLRVSVRSARTSLQKAGGWLCLPCGGGRGMHDDVYAPLTTRSTVACEAGASAPPRDAAHGTTAAESVAPEEGRLANATADNAERLLGQACGDPGAASQDGHKMAGRWIRCPACRRDAWALTPAGTA